MNEDWFDRLMAYELGPWITCLAIGILVALLAIGSR